MTSAVNVKLPEDLATRISHEAGAKGTSPAGLLRTLYQQHCEQVDRGGVSDLTELATKLLGSPVASELEELLKQNKLDTKYQLLLQQLLLALRRTLKQPGPAAEVITAVNEESALYLAVRRPSSR